MSRRTFLSQCDSWFGSFLLISSIDMINKVEGKEFSISESIRELRRINEIFQHLRYQLQSYRVEKWNNVCVI